MAFSRQLRERCGDDTSASGAKRRKQKDGLVICNACRLGRWRPKSGGETEKRPADRITITMDAFGAAGSLGTIAGQVHRVLSSKDGEIFTRRWDGVKSRHLVVELSPLDIDSSPVKRGAKDEIVQLASFMERPVVWAFTLPRAKAVQS